ncbi:MAG: helix-turn-helix domain-containing protein [Parvibaculum sp.]
MPETAPAASRLPASRLPVARALAVLEALGHAPVMQVREIAAVCDLPKSSVVRLLTQLEEAGYAEQLSRAAGWRATSRVLNLSRGFRQSDIVAEVAREPMRAFTKRYQWPLFIGIPEGTEMLVRFGTVKESPLAIDAPAYDAKTPFLLGAVGQAYLAFCPEAERNAIIDRLAQSRRASNRLARNKADLEPALATVRKRGYAITDEATRRITMNVSPRALEGRKHATGIAVPIIFEDRVLGALSLRYFRSALPDSEAAKQFLNPLQKLAGEIAEATRRATESMR